MTNTVDILGDDVLASKYYAGELTSFVDDEIRSIALHAFRSQYNLSFCSCINVSTIGAAAFDDCTKLQQVYFPNAEVIESTAFDRTGINHAEFPKLRTLNSIFGYWISNLKTLSIPMVTEIVYYAFSGCSALSSIYAPNVITWGNNCFYECPFLNSFPFENITSFKGTTIGSGCMFSIFSNSYLSYLSNDLGIFMNMRKIYLNNCNGISSNYIYFSMPLLEELSFGPGFSDFKNMQFSYNQAFFYKLYLPYSGVVAYSRASLFMSNCRIPYILVPNECISLYAVDPKWESVSSRLVSLETVLPDISTAFPEKILSILTFSEATSFNDLSTMEKATYTRVDAHVSKTNYGSKSLSYFRGVKEVNITFDSSISTCSTVYTFQEAFNLVSANISLPSTYSSHLTIGAYTFSSCLNLRDIRVLCSSEWSGYIYINSYAFTHCRNLNISQDFLRKVRDIGNYAFNFAMTPSIMFFDNLSTVVNATAFKNMFFLNSVVFNTSNMISIRWSDYNSFTDVFSNRHIYVPDSLYSEYVNNFDYSTGTFFRISELPSEYSSYLT